MIPGYEQKVANRMGCWNCINSSNGNNATIMCDKHGEKVSGCGICPDWEDWLLSIEKKPVKTEPIYCAQCKKPIDTAITDYGSKRAYCSIDCVTKGEE